MQPLDVPTGRGLSRAAPWIVVLAFAAAALPGLPDLALSKASQARAWCVARTMVDTGDWALPSYQGEPRLKKPPLQSWFQAGAMEITQSTSLRVAGLASFLVAVLFALGPWMLGAALQRPMAGFLGSLLLVSSRAVLVWGVSPEHDLAFAGWIALSWAGLARALSANGIRRDAVVAGLALGAAVLTKGPFALGFVLGTALVAGWGRPKGEPRAVSLKMLWSSLILGALLPVALWLGAVLQRLGSVGAVFDEMRRQALGEGGAHVPSGIAAIAYYFGAIPKAFMPWFPLGVAAGIACLVQRRTGRGVGGLSSMGFATRALLVTFVVLTATPAKQEHYALAALVPLALLAGGFLEEATRGDPRLARLLPWVVSLVGVAFAASRVVPSKVTISEAASGLQVAGSACLALALGAALLGRGLPRRAWLPGCLAAAVLGVAGSFEAVKGMRTEDYRASVEFFEASRQGPSAADRRRPVVGYAAGLREAFDTAVAWMPDRAYERVRSVVALKTRLNLTDEVFVLVPFLEAGDVGILGSEAKLELVGELAPAEAEKKERVLVYQRKADGR